MIFNIEYPIRLVIGEDASLQTGKEMNKYDIKKILCVYDQGIKATGATEKIIKNIQAEGINVIEFDKIISDPPDTIVDEVGELARAEEVDAVLGIGGGSCLDAAKAANVLLGNPGPVKKYAGLDAVQSPGKYVFLIPTTAGTGSEVSQVAAITDSSSGMKFPLFGPNCTATVAIVDPILTLGLPPNLTASTGVDALSHAVEAYTSDLCTPYSDILAKEAISLIAKNLSVAVNDGSNVQARFNMSFAATLAGLAFNQAPPHIGHAIGTPLGARYHLAHGLTIAAVLPGVPVFISDVLPDKLKTVGEALGLDINKELSAKEIGIIVGDAINKLNREIGIPTLKDLNVPESDLPAIAQDAIEDPCSNFAPKKMTVDDLLQLLQKVYAA